MIARECVMSTVAALALLASACGVTDVIGYRALAECTSPACMPPLDAAVRDSGEDASEPDSGEDASEPDSGEDASEPDSGEDAGDLICAAATCVADLNCAAPVPLAIVGDSCGDQPWAAPGFQHALCSCGDYVSEFPLTVVRDPSSAEQGPAEVAVDGTLTAGARIEAAGGVYVAGELQLGADASIDADDVQSMTAIPRCDCSEQVRLVPDAVLALAADNPVGFDAERFGSVDADQIIALECGTYRVPRIAGSSALSLTITGHVVLVVEDDIAIDANLEATLADGALLELFVIGNVRVAGALILGDADDDVRLYVMGPGTIDLEAASFVAGPIYAPNAELVTRSDLETTGSIFVRRAAPGGSVTITYDSTTSRANACDQ